MGKTGSASRLTALMQDGAQGSIEATLVMFASPAAWSTPTPGATATSGGLACMETLVNTSSVGVVIFAAGTGTPASFNRELLRIVDGMRSPGQAPEELLDAPTNSGSDGWRLLWRNCP